ncbi:unnamed protein product [Boreogadus saida]
MPASHDALAAAQSPSCNGPVASGEGGGTPRDSPGGSPADSPDGAAGPAVTAPRGVRRPNRQRRVRRHLKDSGTTDPSDTSCSSISKHLSPDQSWHTEAQRKPTEEQTDPVQHTEVSPTLSLQKPL